MLSATPCETGVMGCGLGGRGAAVLPRGEDGPAAESSLCGERRSIVGQLVRVRARREGIVVGSRMRVSVEGAMCKLLIAIVGTSAVSSPVCFVWLVSRRVRPDGRTTNEQRTTSAWKASHRELPRGPAP